MQTNKQACKPLLPPTCGPARWPHAPLPCTASRQPRELEFWGLLREGKSFFPPQNAVGNFHAWSVSETVEGGETAMNFQQFGAAGSSRGHTCPALSQAAPCCFAGGSSLSPPGWVFPCGICPTRAACGPAATGGFPGCWHPPNWRGSCFPPAAASFPVGSLVAGHHTAGTWSWRCLLPLPPEAGGTSICQQHSSLWPSPPRAPLSLCPEVLAGFIPPKSLLCLPRVSPGLS